MFGKLHILPFFQLNKDWFPPAEASFKRAHIKKLICEVVEDNSEKATPAPCDDDKYPSAELHGMDESFCRINEVY